MSISDIAFGLNLSGSTGITKFRGINQELLFPDNVTQLLDERSVMNARFFVGQIVEHNKAGYRGVIFGVDQVFSLSEEWYEQVARSRPPKDRPWYHVLVDGAEHSTYVAERHLVVSELLLSLIHI